jgi:alkaline phosphatase D
MAMLALLFALFLSPTTAPAEDAVDLIAFGSCIRETRDAPALEAAAAMKPDVFLFLGDNVYADTNDPAEMQESYDALAKQPGFVALRQNARILAVWDDHDYGRNDGGVDWPFKWTAKKLMLDFFDEPADSPRRARDGTYDSVTIGPDGRRVQFLLLDTRWFRSPLHRDPTTDRRRYVPHPADDVTLLGEEQWAWLENELKKPADVRVIATSIQLLPTEHGFEKWANLPKDRDRLLRLIRDKPGVVVLSGDRHSGEISLGEGVVEVTASALNQFRSRSSADEPNRFRHGPLVLDPNFGTMRIEWAKNRILVALRDSQGEVVVSNFLPIEQPK